MGLGERSSQAFEWHRGEIRGAVVLADTVHAISWSKDGVLCMWDLESGSSQAFEGHRRQIRGAVALADGARALSWSAYGTLRLWDLRSLQELTRFVGDDPLTCCVISHDERLAVVGDGRGRVMRFDLPA